MKSNSILFVGCGDLGCRAGALLLAQGAEVTGMRRDTSALPQGFNRVAGDYTRAGDLAFIIELRPDYVVATFNPSGRSVDGYRRGFSQGAANLLDGLGAHRPRGVLTVSSTRVYAERDGGWVDETSPLSADDPRGLAMIEAERILLESPHRASAIRFAGIYGYPGGRLLERIRRGELRPAQPLRFGNRIHRDDCAGFICHLLDLMASGAELAPVYNGVDDAPAPQAEVDTWLAAAMGIGATAAGIRETVDPAVEKTMPSGHKRCSNRLLRESGYVLKYPDYRAGYGAVLAAIDGRPEL